jgi:predicted phosphohydrolase
VKIVSISDTHSFHRRIAIPDGDVFVCAGDITWRGELTILADFCDWMRALPHKHKICIFGNHELTFDKYGSWQRQKAIELIREAGAHYLEDSGVILDEVKFWGTPWQIQYWDWAWNLPRGNALANKWALIPNDTNVLITHSPPRGICDIAPPRPDEGRFGPSNEGCSDLMFRVKELPNLKAHIFGHIHFDQTFNPTMVKVEDGITFINAAVLNNQYVVSCPARVVEI